MKINTQLLISQGLLVILAIMIVFLNIVIFQNIESDANFINYAGQLRILNYKMVHVSHGILKDTDSTVDLEKDLLDTMNEYEDIIEQLIGGSSIANLKKLNHEGTLKYILSFKSDWYKIHKPYYKKILEKNDIDSFEKMNSLVDNHVKEIDKMVSDYSEFSESKVSKAIFRNGLTIFIIVIVSSYSYISVNNKVKKPMYKLLKELDHMNLIDDELSNKINLSQKNELVTMSSYIDELLYDGLTKTYSRKSGLSRLSKILENTSEDSEFSLIFIDINGLKEVNDNLGHEAGDDLLKLTVNYIKETIRDDDFIIRLGGDEFLLALNGVNERKSQLIWERILNKYEKANNSLENPFLISVSHGIIEYNNGFTLEELIRIADEKMYEEKKRYKEDKEYQILRENV